MEVQGYLYAGGGELWAWQKRAKLEPNRLVERTTSSLTNLGAASPTGSRGRGCGRQGGVVVVVVEHAVVCHVLCWFTVILAVNKGSP